MQFFVKLSVAAAFASSIIGALAAPTNSTLLTRAPAQVITKCTVPNTVALTFDDLSWDQVHDEMWRVEQALQRIIGVNPAFMRPPYGNYNDNVREAAGVRGQKLAIWDFDSEDSVGATPARSKQLYDQTISQRPSTILALNHETYERTAHEVIPYAIQKLQAAGYKLVTLAECLGQQPYQSVGSPQTPDASWTC
ncbi:hypothetical protein RSOLAG1IB_06611 [Rhizoctonia solani AG-1 IB]|uniref:NodB homology domain-containing protein n=1 Tax=Thanatephorus cucumeris (strain AG1-IB / isolate 7/3/14) TaxID=1108050 RepID=A0A0B7F8F3_THACB|nr:hypothetical protein RSOLAG1IB_06611 [Rhizoctonia solani AG-1 IB]